MSQGNKRFRLPRKMKKRLKKGIWLYEPDENGNSLQANPTRSQKDYTALKQGHLRNFFDKKNSRKRRKAFFEKISIENFIPDEKLKEYVDDYIREDLREKSYAILLKAKNDPKAVRYYFNFVNAYELNKKNGSYSNISALAIDSAEESMKKEYKKKRQGRSK